MSDLGDTVFIDRFEPPMLDLIRRDDDLGDMLTSEVVATFNKSGGGGGGGGGGNRGGVGGNDGFAVVRLYKLNT